MDWIESEDYNKFTNLETGEIIYAQSAKRGNVVYATRKTKKRDAMKNALEGKVFDYPVKGFRNRRMTRLLLCTVNFDRSKFTAEEAWAALRSTPIEGLDYTYNVINKLNANISKIFGKHGTLTSKEAQSSGYPAPHLIFILDQPVMVERHIGKNGLVSWRLCDQHILDRVACTRVFEPPVLSNTVLFVCGGLINGDIDGTSTLIDLIPAMNQSCIQRVFLAGS